MASDFSINPLPPPLHAICFPFLTRTLCSSAAPLRFNMYLTPMGGRSKKKNLPYAGFIAASKRKIRDT